MLNQAEQIQKIPSAAWLVMISTLFSIIQVRYALLPCQLMQQTVRTL